MSDVDRQTQDLGRRTRALQLLQAYIPCARTAWDLEACIAHYSATSGAGYEAKVRQMAWNVKQSPVLLSTYTAKTLVYLDNATLARGTEVEAWHHTHNATMAYQHTLLHEEHKVKHGGPIACNRCSSCDVEVQQKQTRSADEGMTVFCACRNCGLRWKM